MGHSSSLLLRRSGISYLWFSFFVSSHYFYYYDDLKSSTQYLYDYLVNFFRRRFLFFYRFGFFFSHIRVNMRSANFYSVRIFVFDKFFAKMRMHLLRRFGLFFRKYKFKFYLKCRPLFTSNFRKLPYKRYMRLRGFYLRYRRIRRMLTFPFRYGTVGSRFLFLFFRFSFSNFVDPDKWLNFYSSKDAFIEKDAYDVEVLSGGRQIKLKSRLPLNRDKLVKRFSKYTAKDLLRIVMFRKSSGTNVRRFFLNQFKIFLLLKFFGKLARVRPNVFTVRVKRLLEQRFSVYKRSYYNLYAYFKYFYQNFIPIELRKNFEDDIGFFEKFRPFRSHFSSKKKFRGPSIFANKEQIFDMRKKRPVIFFNHYTQWFQPDREKFTFYKNHDYFFLGLKRTLYFVLRFKYLRLLFIVKKGLNLKFLFFLIYLFYKYFCNRLKLKLYEFSFFIFFRLVVAKLFLAKAARLFIDKVLSLFYRLYFFFFYRRLLRSLLKRYYVKLLSNFSKFISYKLYNVFSINSAVLVLPLAKYAFTPSVVSSYFRYKMSKRFPYRELLNQFIFRKSNVFLKGFLSKGYGRFTKKQRASAYKNIKGSLGFTYFPGVVNSSFFIYISRYGACGIRFFFNYNLRLLQRHRKKLDNIVRLC